MTSPERKPDIGLYQAKYWLRSYLRRAPGLERLSPNALSVLALLPGLLAAWSLLAGWWWMALTAILARMILNTLDGLVAEEFDRKSRLGAYLNRLPGELTDVLIAMALTPYVAPLWGLLWVACVGWVQTLSLLGLAAGGSTQSVGPCGQTDRLAIIAVGCLLAGVGYMPWGWLIPAMCAGCALTMMLRATRSVREVSGLDHRSSP